MDPADVADSGERTLFELIHAALTNLSWAITTGAPIRDLNSEAMVTMIMTVPKLEVSSAEATEAGGAEMGKLIDLMKELLK
jgi:hypothetical protein